MAHPIKQLVADRAAGRVYGIYSACTANEWVIEAVLRRAQAAGQPALIEATANQTNQFGGYTGMTPADFAALLLWLRSGIMAASHETPHLVA